MKNGTLERRHLEPDVLIIGGGTAGCYAAIRLGAEKDLRVLVVEKANIERSGCLAAGVNALNAYISNGHTPADYVEYARRDAEGIIRDDLMMTIAESVNAVTEDLERRGLVILKDAEGHYVTRGWRNVKINGENIKPLLAKGVREALFSVAFVCIGLETDFKILLGRENRRNISTFLIAQSFNIVVTLVMALLLFGWLAG